MQKMGAKIASKDGVITVGHAQQLVGTTVEAGEIRAGVSLLGLALMAEGTTTITKADNILRGYDRRKPGSEPVPRPGNPAAV